MKQTTIIVPMPVETQRDCIVQDGRRYCEDTDVMGRDLGFILLGVVALVAWGALPIVLHESRRWFNGWHALAWYAGTPIVLGLYLVLR